MATDQQPAGRPPLRRLGKYEIVAHIATGGMGSVYKAVDTKLGRKVALKVLTPETAAKQGMVERFHREAKAAAKLHHENIVALIDDGEENGLHYLVLEFIKGIDLQQYISRRGKLEAEEARQILMQAARGLHHAHQQGIVHRDIKPGNFLLTKRNGRVVVKLTDLGLARRIDEDEFRVTRDGTTVGTIDYISPEQATDSRAADVRSDIYSLGCTYYHMLAGVPPFPEGSLPERLMHHLKTEAPDVRRLNGKVPEVYGHILRRMLAKRPEDRYQTADELLQDLKNPDPFKFQSSSERLASLADLASAETLGLLQDEEAALEDDDDHVPSDEDEEDDEDEAEEEETPRSRPVPKRTQAAGKSLAGKAVPGKPAPGKPAPGKPTPKKVVVEREEAEEEEETFAERMGLPPWWPIALGVLALAVLIVLLVVVFSRSSTPGPGPGDKEGDKKATQPPRSVDPGRSTSSEEKGEFAGPPEPILPTLLASSRVPALTTLQREFLEPFAPSALSQPRKVLRVRRSLSATDGFRSLAEALKAAAPDVINVIEIHDNGPLLETPLPALENRHVVLRGGDTHRPLLVWDAGAGKTSQPFLTLKGGSIGLENIDLVTKARGEPEESASCFVLRDADFNARGCTFSVAGQKRSGTTFVRLEAPADSGDGPRTTDVRKVHLQRCYLRGASLTAVHFQLVHADLLVQESLLAGNEQPLVRLVGTLGTAQSVRLVRSTLVAGQDLVRCQVAGDKVGSPRLKFLAWDALLACAEPRSDQTSMLHLGDGLAPLAAEWKGINCVYAGWKNLLRSATKSIPGTAVSVWRDQWLGQEGEKSLEENWPARLIAEPGELPASTFGSHGTPASFAATAGPGPMGCVVGKLPPEPPTWLARTFERHAPPAVALPDVDVPPIPPGPAEFYHGERIEVNKLDLGEYLAARLAASKPGPRVVLHLAGAGPRSTSPLRFKNIPQVAIYFEPPPGKAPPLTLLPKQGVAQPLVEVENGSLELVGVRLACENRFDTTAPGHLVKVRGGDLSLYRCFLQGPLGQAGDAFKGLVHFAGAGEAPAEPFGLALKESILLSGKKLVEIQAPGARVRARQCVCMSLDDGFLVDATALSFPRPALHCLFENCTFALKRGLLALRLPKGLPHATEPVIVQTQASAFLDPFPDEPRQSCLLRVPESALPAGFILWQGKGNAVDHKHLFAYLAPLDTPAARQSWSDWQRLWGTLADQESALVDLSFGVKTALNPDNPALDRLALPPAAFTAGAVPGADLGRLGLLKKK